MKEENKEEEKRRKKKKNKNKKSKKSKNQKNHAGEINAINEDDSYGSLLNVKCASRYTAIQKLCELYLCYKINLAKVKCLKLLILHWFWIPPRITIDKFWEYILLGEMKRKHLVITLWSDWNKEVTTQKPKSQL